MPGGYKQIGPEDGRKFTSENQPKNRGRKPGIRKQLEKMLEAEGSYKVPWEQIVEVRQPEGEDKGYIRIAIPRQDAIAMRLCQMAASGDIQAMRLLIEQTEGRAPQRIELDMPDTGDRVPMGEYTDAEVVAEAKRLSSVLAVLAEEAEIEDEDDD